MSDRRCVQETYRLFAVDEAERVLWDESVCCLGDDEARAVALKRSQSGVIIEVWDAARRVGRMAPKSICGSSRDSAY